MKLKTIPVFFVFFVMGFGDAVGTLVGFVTKEFNLSPALAGLLPFFGFVAYGVFSVPFGILSDNRGKRFVLILSLLLVLIGELIPVISISRYVYVLVAIFLIGLGITGLQVAGNPMMKDVSASGKFSRNLTFAQFVKSIGSNTAPYVVPLVVALGFAWEFIFSIYSLVVALTLISVFFVIASQPEVSEEEETASLKSTFSLLRNSRVLAMVLGIFLYVGAEIGMNSWIATYLESQFGLDIESLATLGIGFFLTSLAIGRLLGSIILNFLSPKKFFLITSIGGIIGIAGMFFNHQWIVIGSIFLAGLSFGNIFPLIFSILIDQMPDRSNELSGLLVMAIVGGAIIPSLMGLIADYSVEMSFVIPLVIFIYITILAFNVMGGITGEKQSVDDASA